MPYFTSRGTWVANSPNAVRTPTAEWATSLILATTKGVGIADKNVRKGLWKRGLGLQNNISGMTFGVIGLGAIGKVKYAFVTAVLRIGSGKAHESLECTNHLS